MVIRSALARDAEHGALAVGEPPKASGGGVQMRLAADAPGLDEAGGAQPAEVPADERLAQARRGR